MSPSKHLILGGLGNLGRLLQKQLLQKGVAVRVLDRPSTVQKKAPVDPSVDVQAYSLGTDDSKSLHSLLENVETVYSIVTPDVRHGTIAEFEATNVNGVQDLVRACQEVGVPKLVYASSIAVTNHLVPTRNGTEQDPLPALDSYQAHYDLTKRLGEDCVLAANDKHNLQTCALRFGAIICGPSGYFFRQAFENPGKTIRTVQGQPFDCISAVDASRALWKAQQRMDHGAAGRAIFVTRGTEEQSPRTHDVSHYLGELLGWPVQEVPSWIISGVQSALQVRHSVMAPFLSKDRAPGIPPHVFMDIPNHEKTFGNGLARQLLQFEPTLNWKQAVEGVAEEYQASL